eukprot:13668973-Ditylum_brightwellii.AAC.1
MVATALSTVSPLDPVNCPVAVRAVVVATALDTDKLAVPLIRALDDKPATVVTLPWTMGPELAVTNPEDMTDERVDVPETTIPEAIVATAPVIWRPFVPFIIARVMNGASVETPE